MIVTSVKSVVFISCTAEVTITKTAMTCLVTGYLGLAYVVFTSVKPESFTSRTAKVTKAAMICGVRVFLNPTP